MALLRDYFVFQDQGFRSKSEARSRFRSFLGASEAICYLPLGLMWSDNGSGDSWGPVGPPGIASPSRQIWELDG